MNNENLIDIWKEKNKISKNYIHFDKRKNSNNLNIKNYITNPEKIEKHSFYPFLHTKIIFKKFSKSESRKFKKKCRDINYSSHIDRLIYSYYSQILNDTYNKYAIKNDINENSIAYRNNLKMNNIHFAKKIFDIIREKEKCFIMVGDFTGFFDNLEHNYLKKQLCTVLEVKELSDDWYAIFKNITKYSYYELDDILRFKQLNYKELTENERIFSPEIFRKIREEKLIKLHKCKTKSYGIPQGSAISAVLANVYMIEFDFLIKEYTKKLDGDYFRYSDDFIIIVPIEEESEVKEIKSEIDTIRKKIPNLKLEPQKTKNYIYDKEKKLSYYDSNIKNPFLNYLGFTFDGKNIFVRDKTLSKYYYRMYKKIKYINVNKKVSKKGNIISCSVLYDRYSIKQKNKFKKDSYKGNFINYIKRAEIIFGEKDNKYIKKVRYTHLKKIKRRLKKVDMKILKKIIEKKKQNQ